MISYCRAAEKLRGSDGVPSRIAWFVELVPVVPGDELFASG